MNNAKGPRSLICFLCGNSFGTKSLAFHIKACYKLRPSNKDRSGDVSLEPPTLYFDVISKKNLSWQEINDYNSQVSFFSNRGLWCFHKRKFSDL